jgi:hypothetical protein
MVQRGVDTGSITFPEIKLKFPSFELPACFVSKSQARMHVESGIAPWESHGYVNAAAGTNEALLLQKIADLEKALDQQKYTPPAKSLDSPADQAAREKSAAEDYARKLAEYQRLLEECERQQKELRDCIRQCLEQHPGNAKSPGGEGHQSPQQTPYQAPTQAPHGMQYGPKPVVDPRVQALPPPNFAEQPAAYLAEPPQNLKQFTPQQYAPQQFVPQAIGRRLIASPQFAPQPLAPPQAVSPQRHVIREPAAPAGRITGFAPGR